MVEMLLEKLYLTCTQFLHKIMQQIHSHFQHDEDLVPALDLGSSKLVNVVWAKQIWNVGFN